MSRLFLLAYLLCICVAGVTYSQPRRDDDNNLYDQNRRRNDQDQMEARQGYEDEARFRNNNRCRGGNCENKNGDIPTEAELKAEGQWIR